MARPYDKNTNVDIEPSTDVLPPSNSSIVHAEEGDFVTVNEQQDLSRGLHQRHVSLIAIAGAIVSVFVNCSRVQQNLISVLGNRSFPRTGWFYPDRWASWSTSWLRYSWSHRLRRSIRARRSRCAITCYQFFRSPCRVSDRSSLGFCGRLQSCLRQPPFDTS